MLPVDLVLQWRYAPLAAVGPDSSLYLCDDNAVLLDADGTLTRIVDVYGPNDQEGQPPLPVDQLPLPTSSVRLPYPLSLAAGDDGVVFVSNRDQVLADDGVGTVSMAAEFSTIWDDIGRADVDGDGRPSVPGALASDGLNASQSPGRDLLVLVLPPDNHLAGPNDPPQLGGFGR